MQSVASYPHIYILSRQIALKQKEKFPLFLNKIGRDKP